MALPFHIYEIENFDPPPNEELICSICHCVFRDPVACIGDWLTLQQTCPICRKYADIFDLQAVVPLITNMIMKLTIRCPNMNKGCHHKCSLEGYNNHLANCEYETVQCKNENCQVNCIRKYMFQHENNECEYRMVECKNGCSMTFPIGLIESHNCIEELKKEVINKTKIIEEMKNEIEDYKRKLNEISTELRQFGTYATYDGYDDSYARYDRYDDSYARYDGYDDTSHTYDAEL
ncbi:E3 ubiquitin-protein ligase NRDP1-like [Centruroides sculpturatus]|uniref:E3 ubiquitin-protein ligase NRDP1-like n=1 Tax=Centruroides sculpturatus TaxID=218467 RepID=UPI000C6CF594|nr:E3 ubiquitin-protein ligase NRDP1-like [Centruroides sculpturatus]